MRAAAHPSVLTHSGVFARCVVEALATLRERSALGYLLPLAAAQLGGLALLASFPHGPGLQLLVPLFLAVGGEAALHYPDAYAALPRAYVWGEVALSYVVGSLCVAALVAALPGTFLRARPSPGHAFARAAKRAPAVWLVALPAVLVVAAATVLVDVLSTHAPAGRVTEGVKLGALGASVLFRTLLAYGLIAVVLGGLGPLRALRRSVGVASRHLLPTAGFVLLTDAITWPVRVFLSDPTSWFSLVSPEATAAVMTVEVFLSVLALHLLTASCTRLYLHLHGVGGES